MKELISYSYEETLSIGYKIGKNLFKGAIVTLHGDLGSGKTAIARGIAKAFMVDDISSPTFTIFHIYEGTIPVYHFDIYRVEEDELEDIGYEEYFYSGEGVTLIEWADRLKRLYPLECLKITIQKMDEDVRKIIIEGIGEEYKKIEDVVEKDEDSGD
ncbi:tRNA (adenosine(37)-N6)-threonylcarbamoyltransferase complex ATPase subunit type 1 TsaE [Caldicellulosiruptor morganii]|uniref:tRNA threonylcarbamoyladenosine biosynthesis protein TsaE n=1 Tax=Caldicellulosiruptor morganii TaxID=1387555 RepID=A0ABY7BMF6_9FIRM|nr:tRNA (adenosine(37)-N6)-threonylcarbamoyltransferase complex ATPase subunit type 1 TsaE [Caldicellulosiruptor morganii]WAM34028.1 tRNA (adenosine(37)-N6)-threonylcarbamoyltransferase complex ATPase subunit type 1 TsaE [Caldicellulosiruptor morganii]